MLWQWRWSWIRSRLDGEYPKEDEWVEVSGVLESYEDDGNGYLRLALDSIEVLEIRGQEIVYQ